jgi:hypothetical protein
MSSSSNNNHKQVFPFELDGQKALGFDTGFDSRAFAQAKFAQFVAEPGVIFRSDDRYELWKASGVREVNGTDGKPTMVVWGPLFEGEHLDLLLNENERQDRTLAVIARWIQAMCAFGESSSTPVSFWPCAAIIGEGGTFPPAIFFAPPGLIQRCIITGGERYVHPDLCGTEAATFTAAAMLYRFFAGTPPFTVADELLLRQDMRDGNFLPVRFAVPGLEPRLASLIQSALSPPPPLEKSRGKGNAAEPRRPVLLDEFLKVLQVDDKPVPAETLIQTVADTELALLEKEKIKFMKIKTASVKTKRFIARNMALLVACLAALIVAIFVGYSFAKSRSLLPSTAGMDPVQVIESYYNAFGELDHQMMEACVVRGTGKNDINMVINFYVLNNVKQVYENSPLVLSVREWQKNENAAPDPRLFGTADLHVEWLAGGEAYDEIHYRVDYTFWFPNLANEQPVSEPEFDADRPSPFHPRSDFIVLVRKKGNWRIAEIKREDRAVR